MRWGETQKERHKERGRSETAGNKSGRNRAADKEGEKQSDKGHHRYQISNQYLVTKVAKPSYQPLASVYCIYVHEMCNMFT
jgi:hypothetical protein